MIVGFSNLTNVCLYFVLANVFGRCKYSGEMVFELGDIFVQKAN
ncbi:unknown [Tannerella sp. CAG:118]|nr:unknown [Tannerella sp. CAG:118]